jgi:hypothetical protein
VAACRKHSVVVATMHTTRRLAYGGLGACVLTGVHVHAGRTTVVQPATYLVAPTWRAPQPLRLRVAYFIARIKLHSFWTCSKCTILLLVVVFCCQVGHVLGPACRLLVWPTPCGLSSRRLGPGALASRFSCTGVMPSAYIEATVLRVRLSNLPSQQCAQALE